LPHNWFKATPFSGSLVTVNYGPTLLGNPTPKIGPVADPSAVLNVGVCAGTVVTKHTWNVAGQIEALTGVPIELVTVRMGRDGHAFPWDTPVKAMRAALREGLCDLVVHCLDEVPIGEAKDLVSVTPKRGSVKDALCAPSGEKLADLPRNARVSVDTDIRDAGLRAIRPDLEIVMTHGSLAHRINQLFQPGSDLDAVLAGYGDLLTIGRTEMVTEVLDPGEIPPMAGQGAIAIETRATFLADNPWLQKALARVDDLPTRLSVRAERALMAALADEVTDPIGTWAWVENNHLILAATIIGDSQLESGNVGQYRHRGFAPVPDFSVDAEYSSAELAELDKIADGLGRKVANHLLQLGAGSQQQYQLKAA
jgi:hydroxymethylbilane synthase